MMRRNLSRCVLLALLAAFSAAPASAGTIVGSFYFERDSSFCDLFGDPNCVPFETFFLTNNASDALAGLTFAATIQIDGLDYGEQFLSFDPIVSGDFAQTLGLPFSPPFATGGQASLVFNGGNVAAFGGTLSLSNLLFDDFDLSDGYSPSFSAEVIYDGPLPVTEAPSWFVVAIGLSALAVGRAFLV